MNWFVLTVKTGHEKAVGEQLRSRDLEAYVPLYRSRRVWSDRMKTVELPLFPSYTFCHFSFEDRLKVMGTPRVRSIVGFGGKPAPLSHEEVATLKAMTESRLPLSPWPPLYTGERVRIRHGALAGIEGNVVREKSVWRVVVTIELLNRGVAVEVERDAIERLASPRHPGGHGERLLRPLSAATSS